MSWGRIWVVKELDRTFQPMMDKQITSVTLQRRQIDEQIHTIPSLEAVMATPIRPQNHCTKCQYNWYPRGHSISIRCPKCNSTEINGPWNSKKGEKNSQNNPSVLGGGCLLIVIVLVIGALLKGRNHPDQTTTEKTPDSISKKAHSEKSDDKLTPIKETGADKKPLVAPDLPKPTISLKLSLELAPPPRRIDPSKPPPGFTSDWVRLGNIRTRVAGIKWGRTKLADKDGREFLSAEPMLAIWVETESLMTANVELRRWINPGEAFARLKGSGGKSVPPVKFPSGIRPAGQLERGARLIPGGLGVIDVLVFELPEEGVRALVLELDGSHVDESDLFIHKIPATVWK